jgi:transglutaminase-like putative cysteine protease
MDRLLTYVLARFAPRVGWPLALLLIAATTGPSLAAADAQFPLPETLIFWAGVAGALLGLGAARLSRPARYAVGLPAALALGVALVAAAGRALPPADLLWADLVTLASAAWGWWSRGLPAAPGALLTPRFLVASFPRLGGELLSAASSGERGAALLVGSISVASTWAGALWLGQAVGAGRPALAWSTPLLIALAATTILGGGGGAGLVMGVALLLLLAATTAHLAREREWERRGAAYSEELRWGVAGWAALAGSVVIAIALVIPTNLPSQLARLLWPPVELPSGLAAIERNIQRGSGQPAAEVGISRLPAVPLGVSLEQAPPDTISLRVVAAPLAPSPWPRYWRARVLNSYDGRRWWANARTGPFYSALGGSGPPPGAIIQQIEDLRPDRGLLLALPNVIGLEPPAGAERLADGSLAALTASPPDGRYRAVSLPPEQGDPSYDVQSPPPDLRASLDVSPGVPQRVHELARTLAADAATPLERALAIEGYLRQLPYAYTVRPLPPDGDAVDQFLFTMREGYCTYYASAMAIMARSLGIPARVAIGYATGTYDEAAGAYIVRERDAHAWPELLIDGRWLPFEPTPVRPLPARAAESGAVPTPAPTAAPAPDAPLWQGWAIGLTATGLACATLAAAVALAIRRRRAPLDWAQRRVERLGARAGVPWPAGATLHEYARLLEGRAGASAALRALVAQIELLRYGGRQLDAAQARRLRRSVAELGGWLRRARRPGRHPPDDVLE